MIKSTTTTKLTERHHYAYRYECYPLIVYGSNFYVAGMNFYIKFSNQLNVKMLEKTALQPSPWNVPLLELHSSPCQPDGRYHFFWEVALAHAHYSPPLSLYLGTLDSYDSTLIYFPICLILLQIHYELLEKDWVLPGTWQLLTCQVVFFDSQEWPLCSMGTRQQYFHKVLESCQVLLNEMAPWSSRGKWN